MNTQEQFGFLVIGAIIGAVFVMITTMAAGHEWHSGIVKNAGECAQYNSTTGNFEWIKHD